jgi:hypothetical protein
MTVTARAEHTPRHPSVPRKMAVPGVGVDNRDHPVLGHFAGDAENAVVTGFEVLAYHGPRALWARRRPQGGHKAATRRTLGR